MNKMMNNNFPQNQAEFLRRYNDAHRPRFNPVLFSRDEDIIIEELKKILLSCERSKYFILKIEKFTVVEDYKTMYSLLREHESIKSDSKDKSINKYDYIDLKDSEFKLLVVDWYMAIKNPKPKMPSEHRMQTLIMVPRYVDRIYFKLFGNYYNAKIQIVDGSTYNNSQSKSKNHNVTLKSLFMATRIYRYKVELKCVDGTSLDGVFYTSRIFNKLVPSMKYLLAAYGFEGAKSVLMVYDLTISDEDPQDDTRYIIKKHNVYVSIPKFIFDNDITAQSLVYTVVMAINNKDYTADDIYTKDFWLKSLGETYNNKSVEKGYSVLESLESIYDIPTKNMLRLPEQYKSNIYQVIVWIIREFSQLRLKDNLDIGTKRIRVEDYIASLYAMKIGASMCTLSEEGEDIQIADIIKKIYIFPDYLLKTMTRDSLVNSRNNVNDLDDAFMALKYSYKGLSGLGESKPSSIPQGYSHVHLSHIGRVDLDSSPANDPGLSGMLCPMAPIYDNYFADFEEPNNWRDEVKAMLEEYRKMKNLKVSFELQENIGLHTNSDKIQSIQDQIVCMEQQVIPKLVEIDESMLTVSPIKPFEIYPE